MPRDQPGWWQKISINPVFIVVGLVYWWAGHGMMMVIAFIAVASHELAHAVVAEAYDLSVNRIEIWPFGGIAEIPGLHTEGPYVESMVAVAGPLQNFVLAFVAWMAARWLPFDPRWVHSFIEASLFIGAINLLPVAPLDGGHLAKSYWASQVGYREAERRVSAFGRWLAYGMMVITAGSFLSGHPLLNLGLFAGFLYWGAIRMENQSAYLIVRDLALRQDQFARRPVWLVQDFAVRQDAPIKDVLKVMRPQKYHRIIVLDDELKRLGTLYEEQLLKALTDEGPETLVGELLP